MDSIDVKHYVIGDRKFTQSVPVAGQLTKLAALGATLQLDWDNFDLESLAKTLASNDLISRFCAIVIREENVPLKKVNYDELTDFINETATFSELKEILSDFFVINDILTKLRNFVENGGLQRIKDRVSTIQGTLSQVFLVG